MPTLPIYQVDAFTSTPFRGNPAAVCLLSEPLDNSTMQSIAAEMNLSETAFVSPMDPSSSSFREATEFSLRWFTPTVEVPLCGHATLATSAVLFFETGNGSDTISYHTLSGILTARRSGEKISLDFPGEMPDHVEPPLDLLNSMGIVDPYECHFAPGSQKLLVILEGEHAVTGLKPDFKAMLDSTSDLHIAGVIVSSKGEPPYDFISRFFAPWWGIDEDPVTGAAHTVLAPYWSRRLGKENMKAYQASARSGELDLRLGTDGRVEISGSAIVIMRGDLNIQANP